MTWTYLMAWGHPENWSVTFLRHAGCHKKSPLSTHSPNNLPSTQKCVKIDKIQVSQKFQLISTIFELNISDITLNFFDRIFFFIQ